MNEEYSSGRPVREFADGASRQAADDFRFGSIGRGVRAWLALSGLERVADALASANWVVPRSFPSQRFFGAGELFLCLPQMGSEASER